MDIQWGWMFLPSQLVTPRSRPYSAIYSYLFMTHSSIHISIISRPDQDFDSEPEPNRLEPDDSGSFRFRLKIVKTTEPAVQNMLEP